MHFTSATTKITKVHCHFVSTHTKHTPPCALIHKNSIQRVAGPIPSTTSTSLFGIASSTVWGDSPECLPLKRKNILTIKHTFHLFLNVEWSHCCPLWMMGTKPLNATAALTRCSCSGSILSNEPITVILENTKTESCNLLEDFSNSSIVKVLQQRDFKDERKLLCFANAHLVNFPMKQGYTRMKHCHNPDNTSTLETRLSKKLPLAIFCTTILH